MPLVPERECEQPPQLAAPVLAAGDVLVDQPRHRLRLEEALALEVLGRERRAGERFELARLQDVDLGVYLVDDLLVKTDRASMAHSLEARVPYLDTVVTNLALALPTRHKVRGLSKKVLLRKAAEPLVPREIVHGKKRGFSIPAAAWLRGRLEPFARDTLSADTLRRQGFFEPRVVQRLLDDHVAGREDLSRQLWGLLAFTLWHERHVERRPGAARMPALLAER